MSATLRDLLAAVRRADGSGFRTVRIQLRSAFSDVAVDLQADPRADLGLVLDRLAPYAVPVDAGRECLPPGETVRLVRADPELTEPVGRLCHDCGTAGEATAAGAIRLIVRGGAGPAPAVVAWHTGDPSLTWVLLGGSTSPVHVARTIRAVLERQLVDQGWLPVHAACAWADGGGTLLTGPSGSGKTTTLLRMIVEEGADFVANDRVFLNVRRSVPVFQALPVAVRIRPGSVAVPSLTRAGLASSPALTRPPGSSRYAIEPTDLAAAFGCHIRSSGPLRARRAVTPPGTELVVPGILDARGDLAPVVLPDDRYERARIRATPQWLDRRHAATAAVVTRRTRDLTTTWANP